MGRPRKDGMDYFPHDVDAVADEKIEALRTMFGNDGYAFYFIALERIYRSGLGELDVSNRLFILTLANKVMVTEEKIQQMIDASTDFGLFDKDEFIARKALTSNGIKKRSIQINGLRDKWRGKKNESEESFLDGKVGFSLENTTEKTMVFPLEKCIKESKGKESKVKQSKYSDYVTMAEGEYANLISEYGLEFTKKCISELDNYKGATGKTYKSDYRAILSWVIKRVEEQNNREVVSTYSKPQYKPSGNQKPKMQMVNETSSLLTQEEMDELREMGKRIAENTNPNITLN
jgi:hypothetical protein